MAADPVTESLFEVNFGVAEPFALGVEEELLLVGPDRMLHERGPQVARESDPDEGEVVGELFKAMVESNSDISADAREATATLRELRREILDSGQRIMGVGVHPMAKTGEIQDTPRYLEIKGDLKGILRTPICGQHIHVGMPDADSAVRAYNGIRTHVPLLNALAANSPFWFGRDSGLASARTVIFRSYPRAAMAPEFDDFEHFRRVVLQVCTAAGLTDYTHIWWDARLHPALGTIELRAADAQFDLRRVGALAALVHCLVKVESERDQSDIPAREALAESSFQATRYGLDADLLDRNAERVPARELGKQCLELATEACSDLRCETELGYVETMLRDGSGADLQRQAYADDGMDGLLAFLEERTADLDQASA